MLREPNPNFTMKMWTCSNRNSQVATQAFKAYHLEFKADGSPSMNHNFLGPSTWSRTAR